MGIYATSIVKDGKVMWVIKNLDNQKIVSVGETLREALDKIVA